MLRHGSRIGAASRLVRNDGDEAKAFRVILGRSGAQTRESQGAMLPVSEMARVKPGHDV
jgi:hypothetical protein